MMQTNRNTSLSRRVGELHQLARRQLTLLQDERWKDACRIMDKRRSIVDALKEGHSNSALPSSIKKMGGEIIAMDEKIKEQLTEAQISTMKKLRDVRKLRRTVSAYDTDPSDLPEAPRFIDERR